MYVSVDNKGSMRRRNTAACLLAVTLGAGTALVPPTPSLTLTFNPPTIYNGLVNLPVSAPGAIHYDRSSTQRLMRRGAYLKAIESAPSATGQVSVNPISLGLAFNPPSVSITTPVMHGSDLQTNREYREDFFPKRRPPPIELLQFTGNIFNVNPLPLSLSFPTPTVTLTGTVQPPTLGVTLGFFAPLIIQQNSGRVDVPLMALSLAAPPPDLFVTGSLLVAPPVLVMSFGPVTITQGTSPGQANLPLVPYISGIGPWDITVRTYG